MAKLIVRRPRAKASGFASRSYQILIDGKPVASIGNGEMVEIELTPGRHLVRARINVVGSQPVEIDADGGEVHSLAVNYDRRMQWIVLLVALLPSLIQIGVILWDASRGGPRSGNDIGWLWMFLIPFSFLPVSFLVLFLRNYLLALGEISSPDLTDQQIAESLESRPLRFRVTIRQIMIAVALLAIFLGAAIQLIRLESSGRFRSRARLHARIEESLRELERDNVRYAVDCEKRGRDASFFRKLAAGNATKADYHAAMRRKYEEAAARHFFFVEPDPPEPP